MMAVAVVASGDIGGDVRLAERHGFAVVGIAIMFQPVLVAFAADLVAGHLKVAVLRSLDFVRAVAIRADRSTLVALGEELAVDALQVCLFDANVAFAAGLGDIDMVDRRFAVHRPFDIMRTWPGALTNVTAPNAMCRTYRSAPATCTRAIHS